MIFDPHEHRPTSVEIQPNAQRVTFQFFTRLRNVIQHASDKKRRNRSTTSKTLPLPCLSSLQSCSFLLLKTLTQTPLAAFVRCVKVKYWLQLMLPAIPLLSVFRFISTSLSFQKQSPKKMCAFLWFYPTTVRISAHLPPGFQFSIGGGIMTATTNLELIHFSVSNEHD